MTRKTENSVLVCVIGTFLDLVLPNDERFFFSELCEKFHK